MRTPQIFSRVFRRHRETSLLHELTHGGAASFGVAVACCPLSIAVWGIGRDVVLSATQSNFRALTLLAGVAAGTLTSLAYLCGRISEASNPLRPFSEDTDLKSAPPPAETETRIQEPDLNGDVQTDNATAQLLAAEINLEPRTAPPRQDTIESNREITNTRTPMAQTSEQVTVEEETTDSGHEEVLTSSTADAMVPHSTSRPSFLAEAARELRAPVTSISLAARILYKRPEADPDVVAKFATTLLQEAENLVRLVDEFTDLARFESGTLDWDNSSIDVESFAKTILMPLEEHAQSRDLGLKLDIKKQGLALDADRHRATQVFTCLLENAIFYAKPGATVSLSVSKLGASRASFVVKNGGLVFPPEDAARLFSDTDEPSQSTPETGDSTANGLGLWVCQEIIHHYGGRLEIEHDGEQNSAFRFTFPLDLNRRETKPVPATQAAPEPPITTPDESTVNVSTDHHSDELEAKFAAAADRKSRSRSDRYNDVVDLAAKLYSRSVDKDDPEPAAAPTVPMTEPDPQPTAEATSHENAIDSEFEALQDEMLNEATPEQTKQKTSRKRGKNRNRRRR